MVRVPVARRDGARVRTRRVDVVADRDRQQVALRRDPCLTTDDRGAESHDPAEGIADIALDRDAHVPARIDQDARDQVELVAGVPRLVLRCHRDAGRRTGGAGGQVASEHVTPLGFGIGRGLSADERIRDRERPGVGGVLEESLLAVEPADVERQAGDAHQGHERDREDDDDLPMGTVRTTTSPTMTASAIGHQLATIVTSEVSPRRPFASRGRSWAMSGMIRSWW